MISLSKNEENRLLSLARETLEASFGGSPKEILEAFEPSGNFIEYVPCFVTLTTQGGRLRGCIGNLEAHAPLYQNVSEYARHAAFDDPRFEALKREELQRIKIEITLLGPMLELPNFDLVEVGKHGLYVKHEGLSGVLLAHVATQFGWDKKTFRQHTCEKAQLNPANWESYRWYYFEEVAFSEAR